MDPFHVRGCLSNERSRLKTARRHEWRPHKSGGPTKKWPLTGESGPLTRFALLHCYGFRRSLVIVAGPFQVIRVFVAVILFMAVFPLAAQPVLPSLISMDDAVRIALAYNQTLRAQRLNIDQSKPRKSRRR